MRIIITKVLGHCKGQTRKYQYVLLNGQFTLYKMPQTNMRTTKSSSHSFYSGTMAAKKIVLAPLEMSQQFPLKAKHTHTDENDMLYC